MYNLRTGILLGKCRRRLSTSGPHEIDNDKIKKE